MREIEMKSRVRGRVLLPGEVGYDTERNGWNLIVEHDLRSAQPVSGQPQYSTATEPWKSSLVKQWRHETRTTTVCPFTCSSLLTVRVQGGLIVPPGQVRNQLQLRRPYRPTVAGDQENTAKISTPRF